MEFIEQGREKNKMTKKEIIEKISRIKGIGKAKAELLYNNGFDSLEKIRKSSIQNLTKIKGINENLAKNIKKQIDDQIKPYGKEDRVIKEKKLDQKTEKEILEEKEKTDETDIQEKKYFVKKKPKLTKENIQKLIIRKQIKKRTPNFLREEWFRYKRIPKNWRKPDGITSKMRINLKYRPNKVRVGYRGPKDVRGLHSSGYKEILIHNINQLRNIDKSIYAIRIGSTVGTKKRIKIQEKAEEMDIRILNTVRRKND
jgi:large subunit ribosomal protein L32e